LAEKGRGRTVSSLPNESVTESALKTIGLLVSQSKDSYGEFTQIYRTVCESNHNLTIYTLKPGESDCPLENISRRNTSGILVYCQQILKSDIVDFSSTIPTVSLMHRCSDFNIPSYYLSWPLATYQCSMHLFERGYRHQLLENSTASYHSQWNTEFYEGFSCAHTSNNVPVNHKNIFDTQMIKECPNETDFEKVLSAIKEHGRVGITSYFTQSTLSLINKALANGIKIPEQLGVACIFDTERLQESPIPVTAVSFDRLSMVEQATKTLIKLINKEPVEAVDNPYHGKLTIRHST
jgi:DNA-binding LacI/PurR family transcriptional regulator